MARGPIKSVISTMLMVMENLNLGTITTQIHFAINITNKTEFSKHIWQLQDKGINFTLKWSITDCLKIQMWIKNVWALFKRNLSSNFTYLELTMEASMCEICVKYVKYA